MQEIGRARERQPAVTAPEENNLKDKPVKVYTKELGLMDG